MHIPQSPTTSTFLEWLLGFTPTKFDTFLLVQAQAVQVPWCWRQQNQPKGSNPDKSKEKLGYVL